MLLSSVAVHGWNPGGDQVGLAFKGEEGGDGIEPLLNLAPQQQAAVVPQRTAKQQPWFPQIGRSQEPLQRMANREAAITAVVGIDVLFPVGIVELAHLAGCHRIERGRGAVIELRFANRKGGNGLGCGDTQVRQPLHLAVPPEIFDEVLRESVGAPAVDR